MIRLDLSSTDTASAIISTDDRGADLGSWARLQEALQRGIQGGSDTEMEVALNVLLAELGVLREVIRTFGTPVELGNALKTRIAKLARDRKARESAADATPTLSEEQTKTLDQLGFIRKLRPFQSANLARILALPHAADFSVPGAGKTTVALANFALQRSSGRAQQAFVVAPISAFSAWQEEAQACFSLPPRIHTHSVGRRIPVDTDILVTNYHRLVSDFPVLRSWVGRRPTQVILDEAHRMKRGRDGVHGRAALDLAFDAERRDILTGTPTPQGANDLVALIEYLYPGQAKQILPETAFVPKLSLDNDVLRDANRAIRRYFVRTCKTELGLPPTKMRVVAHPMGAIQSAIYQALVGTYRGGLQLSTKDRRDMKRLGEIVMYLLEAATNPLLLRAGSDEFDLSPFAHPPLELQGREDIRELMANYGSYERPWKYEYVCSAVADRVRAAEKTLIWTNFVRNIRLLEIELKEFNPAIIHGGIPTADSERCAIGRTRESELERFRHDPACGVLLANPAAAGEGISLHHSCHHAIYLDRTFNAGHFLQSQDRIHRLGLSEGTITRFTFLLSAGTIDESVNNRLKVKVEALSVLLNDPGLVRVSLPAEDDDDDGGNEPAFGDDFDAVREHLGAPVP